MSYQGFLGIVVAFLFTVFLPSCENDSRSDIDINLHQKDIQGTSWFMVSNDGEPKVENHQKSELFFLEDNEFELRKTFEYSGSTFRSIGKYDIKDSMIRLESMNGSLQLGEGYLYGEKLEVQWKDSIETYGEGTDYFKSIQ
ncbi:MAG: hypothetical protein R6U04_14535 [Bacteroidales bacterium]